VITGTKDGGVISRRYGDGLIVLARRRGSERSHRAASQGASAITANGGTNFPRCRQHVRSTENDRRELKVSRPALAANRSKYRPGRGDGGELMWQFLLFLVVLLIIGAVIFYGWAKLVVACVLITAAISVVMFFTYAIVHELRQPPKQADPNNPSADE